MADEIKTVEVPEPVKTEPVQRPTVQEAKDAGWSAAEIESAKKRNMLVEEQTPEEKAKKEAEGKAKAEAEAAAKGKTEEKPEEGKDKKSVPAKSFLDEVDELTPEQEKAFLAAFPPGTKPRALYFRMKNERSARQAAEQREKELKAQLAAVKSGEPKGADPVNPEDEDKPLTLKQLRELQKAEADAIAKKQAENEELRARVAEAQKDQEEYARSIYQDFDDTVKRAAEVMKDLETLVPEKHRQAKVVHLIRQLQWAAANADKIDLDDYHAAHIAYEIGQFHPDHGKKAEKQPDGNQPPDPKANGGLTPEQMERIAKNTQRKPSSASIPGGNGRRTVTPEDVTPEDLNRMNYKERSKFKADHPQRYAELVRG